MKPTEKRWTEAARTQLLGRRIVSVRYMMPSEARSLGWEVRPVVLQLDDGNLLYASSDDEGNDAGAFFTNNAEQPVLPVLGMED